MSDPLPERLIRLLADGRFHSGEAMAAAAGVSRAGIWKAVQRLKQFGLTVCAVRGRGYRLAQPLDLLDADAVRAALGADCAPYIDDLEIRTAVDSTNRHLLERARSGARSGSACLAEMQHAGRGRSGRAWVSPFAANLYLSLLWRFPGGAPGLTGLSLVAGVAGVGALAELGVEGVGLKWPNDLVWNGRKLGGILIEVAGESAGPCHAVIGVGINVSMPDAAGAAIEQPWTDLTAITGTRVARGPLAGRLLRHLVLALGRFAERGFAPFAGEWRRLDAVAGRAVDVHLPDRTVTGIGEGVDAEGALLLRIDGRRHRFTAGEVSLRVRS